MQDVGYGDGGIMRRADGRLMIRVSVGGRRVHRYAHSQKEAQDIWRRLVDARESSILPQVQTLAAFLGEWIGSLRDARRQRVKPRTLDGYAMIVERHLIPHLGRHRLDRLTEAHVQAWIDANPGRPQTIDNQRAVLRKALNRALDWQLVSRNVAVRVELPARVPFAGAPLTFAEARALLDATADDRLGALWRLAIDTGFREAELLGLGWEDIDLGEVRRDGDPDGAAGNGDSVGDSSHIQFVKLERGVDGATGRGGGTSERRAASGGLGVDGRNARLPATMEAGGSVRLVDQLQRRHGRWGRVPTKAARTLERVALAPDTVAALRAHKLRQATERRPDWEYWGLVFVTPDGQPLSPKVVLLAFWRACDAAGIAKRRFHDLRLTSATLLRELGVAEDIRQGRLGHSTKAMARHYAKARDGIDRGAADALGEALRRAR